MNKKHGGVILFILVLLTGMLSPLSTIQMGSADGESTISGSIVDIDVLFDKVDGKKAGIEYVQAQFLCSAEDNTHDDDLGLANPEVHVQFRVMEDYLTQSSSNEITIDRDDEQLIVQGTIKTIDIDNCDGSTLNNIVLFDSITSDYVDPLDLRFYKGSIVIESDIDLKSYDYSAGEYIYGHSAIEFFGPYYDVEGYNAIDNAENYELSLLDALKNDFYVKEGLKYSEELPFLGGVKISFTYIGDKLRNGVSGDKCYYVTISNGDDGKFDLDIARNWFVYYIPMTATLEIDDGSFKITACKRAQEGDLVILSSDIEVGIMADIGFGFQSAGLRSIKYDTAYWEINAAAKFGLEGSGSISFGVTDEFKIKIEAELKVSIKGSASFWKVQQRFYSESIGTARLSAVYDPTDSSWNVDSDTEGFFETNNGTWGVERDIHFVWLK